MKIRFWLPLSLAVHGLLLALPAPERRAVEASQPLRLAFVATPSPPVAAEPKQATPPETVKQSSIRPEPSPASKPKGPSQHRRQATPTVKATPARPKPARPVSTPTVEPVLFPAQPEEAASTQGGTTTNTGIAATPRPSADAVPGTPNGPVEAVFGDIDGPAFVRRVVPVYPRLSVRRGEEGTVTLRLQLATDGTLLKAEVLQSAGARLDTAALAAARASRYRPACRGGVPVPCRALLPITFRLEE